MRISTVLSVFVELYFLFGVQFDDKCFVNFDRKFFTLRKTSECSFEAFQVFFNVRKFERTKFLEVSFEHFVVTRCFAQFDYIAWFAGEGRNVYATTVYQDVAMVYHLTSLTNGVTEADAIYKVIKTLFQKDQHVLTCNTLHFFRFIIIAYELAF